MKKCCSNVWPLRTFQRKDGHFSFLVDQKGFCERKEDLTCAEGFIARPVATKDMICSAVMGETELHKEQSYSMG